jgi:threonylcarbamoyladenosine tRNA methylthiotransferase MtaB
MRFAIYTLGCKVNQYETQAMETLLQERGHEETAFDAPADAYIINTCSVTAVSDKKCRNMIRRARKLAPNSILAVCGCYAQAKPEDIAALGADVVYGTGKRLAFLDAVEEAVEHRTQKQDVDVAVYRKDAFEVLPAGGLAGRTRALMKIEDGCANFCTYCIIPYARGPVRSEALADAVAQAQSIAAEGYHEIVLTGIEISSWGQDLPGEETLIDLLEAVCHAVPGLRIRLGSLEPRTITEEFCRRAAQLPNLCPHFHLSLQSGCDATLKRMNRHYTTQRFLESCRLLRAYFDRPAITTDLICGFVGETEEEFAETLAFLSQAQFAEMHIFPYSRRSGTVADRMEGHLTNEEKENRCHQAAAVARELQQTYLRSFLGDTLPVLFEETVEGKAEGDGLWKGHAPNYVQVLSWGKDLHNVLRSVRVEGIVDGTRLNGELV